jgi:hypothetical protein
MDEADPNFSDWSRGGPDKSLTVARDTLVNQIEKKVCVPKKCLRNHRVSVNNETQLAVSGAPDVFNVRAHNLQLSVSCLPQSLNFIHSDLNRRQSSKNHNWLLGKQGCNSPIGG